MTDLPRRAPAGAVGRTGPTVDRELLQAVLAGLERLDLETCGGTLVVHADGRAECLDDPRCATDPALHVGLVSCADALADGCCERASA